MRQEKVKNNIKIDIPPHELCNGLGIQELVRLINMILGFILGIPAAIIIVIILIIMGAESTSKTWQSTNLFVRFLLVIPCGLLYGTLAQSLCGADLGKAIGGLRNVN